MLGSKIVSDAPSEERSSGPVDKRNRMRLWLAISVMLIFVLVLGYGSYIRGMLIVEDGNPLARQNAVVSAVFSAGLALIEEIAVVAMMMGFVIPLYPILTTSLRLHWLRRRFYALQGYGIVHEAVVEAVQSTDQLTRDCKEVQSQIDKISDQLAVRDLSTVTSVDLDDLLNGFAERRSILSAEDTSISAWIRGFEPDLAAVEALSYREAADAKSARAGHQGLQDKATALKTRLTDRYSRLQKQKETAGTRTALQEGNSLNQIMEIGSRLRTLERRAAELERDRLAILTKLHADLNSEQFLDLYTELSQVKTLKALGDLLVSLDGSGSLPAETSRQIGITDRIHAALADLHRRAATIAPDKCPLGAIRNSLTQIALQHAAAFDRLKVATDPQVTAEIIAVEDLEARLAAQLADLGIRVNKVITMIKADAGMLAERDRAERRAKSWWGRVLRKLFPQWYVPSDTLAQPAEN